MKFGQYCNSLYVPLKNRVGWWITTCYVRVFRYGACQHGQWRRPFPACQPGQEIGEASFDPPPASSLGPHGCDLQRMQIDGSQKVFFGVSQHRCHVIKLFQSLSTISQSETYFSFQDTVPFILTHPAVNLVFIPVIGQKNLCFLFYCGQVSKAEFGAHLCVRSAKSIPLRHVRIEAWANEDAARELPSGQPPANRT